MANEDKKDFNAMLRDNKDMPKVQLITDEKSIAKYGGNRMYFAPPMELEGHTIVKRGRTNIKYYVKDYEEKMFGLERAEKHR